MVLILSLLFSLALHSQTLYLYGGENNEIFLGCLNCDDYSSNSIWNDYGKYGSNYSSISIWNDYGIYGDDYSIYSPWNEYASDPPIIIDGKGHFYGYLTTNKYHVNRATFELALLLYKYHDLIKEDVSTWYEKIFE